MEVSCLKKWMDLEGMRDQGCTEEIICIDKYFKIPW